MVQKGIEYLDKLAADAGNRADLRRELAAGYLRVGDVQGRPLNPNLGDTAGALASYQEVRDLYQSLGVSEASPADLRREAAMAFLRLSELLAATGDTEGGDGGGPDGRLPWCATPRLTRRRPGGPARSRGGLQPPGRHARVDRRHLRGARTAPAGAQRDAERLGHGSRRSGQPSTIGRGASQGGQRARSTRTLPNVGDHAGALVEMQQSVAVFERASALYPDNAMFRRNLAVARSNVADILDGLGRRQEARAEERRALETYEAQVREDPSNAAAKNDLAIAFYKAAQMLDADGRTREALVSLDRAVVLQDQLAAADPESTRARGETATNYALRGRLLAKLGERVASLSSLRRALDISRALSQGNPDNVELRVAVASVLIERADAALS